MATKTIRTFSDRKGRQTTLRFDSDDHVYASVLGGGVCLVATTVKPRGDRLEAIIEPTPPQARQIIDALETIATPREVEAAL